MKETETENPLPGLGVAAIQPDSMSTGEQDHYYAGLDEKQKLAIAHRRLKDALEEKSHQYALMNNKIVDLEYRLRSTGWVWFASGAIAGIALMALINQV